MTDFPLIRAAHGSERNEKAFDKALRDVVAYTAEGVLIKAEFGDIKDAFTRAIDRAWDVLRKAHFFTPNRSKEVEELFWSFSIPYPHVLPGYLKRTLATKTLPVAVRDDLVALLAEGIALNDMLVALKPLVGKRAPQRTAKQVEREGNERTCQICGRGILGHAGIIAHHGYQRPGDGWQTDSCNGARELPFELSREKLGEEIVMLKQIEADRLATFEAFRDETRAYYITFSIRRQIDGRWQYVDETIKGITRENFDAMKAAQPQEFGAASVFSFDNVKERCVYKAEQAHKHIHEHRIAQDARYAGWKQTAIFDGERYWLLGQEVKVPNGDVAKIANFYQHYPAQPTDIVGGVRLAEMADGFVSWNVQELEAVG